MDAPALRAGRLDGYALRALVLYISLIMIALTMTVKPAHASGTVSPTTTWEHWANSGINYGGGYASAAAACASAGLGTSSTPYPGFPD